MAKDYYGLAYGLQLLDVIPQDELLIFAKWNACKYIIRAGKKTENALSDLKKARDYLNIMIEINEEAAEKRGWRA